MCDTVNKQAEQRRTEELQVNAQHTEEVNRQSQGQIPRQAGEESVPEVVVGGEVIPVERDIHLDPSVPAMRQMQQIPVERPEEQLGSSTVSEEEEEEEEEEENQREMHEEQLGSSTVSIEEEEAPEEVHVNEQSSVRYLTGNVVDPSGMTNEERINLLKICIVYEGMEKEPELSSLVNLLIAEHAKGFYQNHAKDIMSVKAAIRAYIISNRPDEFIQADLEAKTNIFRNIETISSYLLDNDPNVQFEQRERGDFTGTGMIADFYREFAVYERLIDENPMYSQDDKLVRKLEYYKTYEPVIENSCMDYQTVETGVKLAKFRNTIKTLETQIKDRSERKAVLLDGIQRHRAIIEDPNTPEDIRANEQAGLEALITMYNETFTSSYKDDLFALDNSTEHQQKWKADETLDSRQIDAVRVIDRYLLSQATDEYKDKIFMAQIMGCTIRQRLCIYLCVELGVDKMDYGTMLYSQSSYLPSLDTIKSEMIGASFILRKYGLKRGHWSKVRRAYEYVTKNSSDLDAMADASQQMQETLEQPGEQQLTSDRLDSSNTAAAALLDDGVVQADEQPMNSDEMHGQILVDATSMLQTLQILRNTEDAAAREALNEELMNKVAAVRRMVDRQIEITADPKSTRYYKNFKTCLNAFNDYYIKYLHAPKAIEDFMRFKGIVSDGKASDAFDVFNAANLFIKPANSIIKLVVNGYDMFADWKDKSKMGNTKDVIKSLSNAKAVATSLDAVIKMGTDFGYKPVDFATKRLKEITKLKDTQTKFGVNAKFDIKKFGTVTSIIGSALTLSTFAVDMYNVNRARTAKNSIRDQIGASRLTGDGQILNVTEQSRKDSHKAAIANLTERINTRTLISSSVNVVTDAVGYLKYILNYSPLGWITSAATSVAKLAVVGVNYFLKKRSDRHAVDDFINMEVLEARYKKEHNVAEVSDKIRERIRKRAMLQLGFANTATFFKHVADKLALLIHSIIDRARGHNAADPESVEAAPFVTLLRSWDINVDPANNIIPKPSKISGKLSA